MDTEKRRKQYKEALNPAQERMKRLLARQVARETALQSTFAAGRRKRVANVVSNKKDEDVGEAVGVGEMGLTHGIFAAAPAVGGALASGVKSWWEGKGFAAGLPALDPTTALPAVAGVVVGLKDKHYQIQQLALEVNEALNYIDSVKQWISKVETCETDLIASQVQDMQTYIEQNFLNGSSFLQRLIAADRRAMEVLRNANKDPEGTIARLKELMADMFLDMWPDYYRSDLNARMLKLIEIVKTSIMESILRGNEPQGVPQICTKPKVIKELQVAKEPSVTSVSAFLKSDAVLANHTNSYSPSILAAGGRRSQTRKTSRSRSRSRSRSTSKRRQRKVHKQYF